MDKPTKPDWLTVKEAADALGVTSWTIHNWCRDGKIEFRRLPSGQLRVLRSTIDAILTGANL